MNVLAILKDFTFRCKSIFENTTTKMSKRFLNWLILTIRTVALIPGKVNLTRLSRYGGRTAKTFASNFKTPIDWKSAALYIKNNETRRYVKSLI